jgi:hypothetical protein
MLQRRASFTFMLLVILVILNILSICDCKMSWFRLNSLRNTTLRVSSTVRSRIFSNSLQKSSFSSLAVSPFSTSHSEIFRRNYAKQGYEIVNINMLVEIDREKTVVTTNSTFSLTSCDDPIVLDGM